MPARSMRMARRCAGEAARHRRSPRGISGLCRRTFRGRIAKLAAASVLLVAAAPGRTQDDAGGATVIAEARLLETRQIVRTIDCARCHGKDYDGWAAPSILAFVRTQSRARFEAVVLDGDVVRGMPGYRSNERVAMRIGEIYEYFLRLGAR